MTLQEFQQIAPDQQVILLWEKGAHVDFRDEAGFRYVLYQIDAFYVEVKYDPVTNAIVDHYSFGIELLPDTYLEKIDLTKLHP